MRGVLEEDEKGKEEAQKTVGGAPEPMRPKDKFGLELALDVVCVAHRVALLVALFPLLPSISPCTTKDIDKEFRRKLTRRFCGWEDAVKAASEVLIDEMRTLLEHPP